MLYKIGDVQDSELITQDKSALEDARNWECDEEAEEDEHDVVDGEGGGDTCHDLDHGGNQHRKSATESDQRKEVNIDQGSIQSKFYAQILLAQIPKAQKDTDDLTVFFLIWDLCA